MTCSQCTGRCLGPALATQSRSVSCKHFSNSTSKTCDPKERCQCYAVFSITHSHMHSAVNVLFLLIWFSNTFRPSSVRNCSSEMCDVHWKVFPWRTCTAACGSGFQSRRVECIHRQNKKTLPDQHCAWQRRPSTWQHCNITSCGSESLKTPCYKPEHQYGSGNVCPSEHSWFIRENIRTLEIQVITASQENWLSFAGFLFFNFTKLGHFRNPVCPNICFLFFTLLRWNLMKHHFCVT